jgi:hypothetical protein
MFKFLVSLSFITFFSTTFFAQSNSYKGKFDNDDIKSTLTFNQDETVNGSFYYVSNPSRIYKISGTNFIKGEMEIIISFSGKRIGAGTLHKSISDTHIIWEGDINTTNNENLNLLLKRPR